MKCSKRYLTFFVLTILLLDNINQVIGGSFEPYKVLGVHRRAPIGDIRKAYKRLAREWHPDKVSGEQEKKEAEVKFIEINRAYELLSDPDRRRKYDNHGITEDTPNFRKSNEDIYGSYGRFDHDFHDTFQEFFGSSGGFKFGFKNGGGGDRNGKRIFHKQSITSKAYYSTVLKNTKKQPYLILFYSDWCFTCLRIEPIWSRLTEELEPVGFGIATVHTEHEKELARKISVKEVPHMVLLLEDKIFHYKEGQFSAIKTIEWIRRKLPYKMVQNVDDSNIDSFLSGWMDNKVRVLIFGKLDVIRLRYLTTAYRYRERALFGFVQLKDSNARNTLLRFGISKSKEMDTILLFNEDHNNPLASLSMKDIPLKAMQELVEENQFLQLPRLSSQPVFDTLCPPAASKPRRRLCVVLVNQDATNQDDNGRRRAMRDFVVDHKFSKEKVRFVYVLKEKQLEFVNSLVTSPDESKNVAIVWRTEENNIRYEWLSEEWPPFKEDPHEQEKLNETRQALKKTLQSLLIGNELLSHEAVVKELFDEHATSVFVRIANRMLEIIEVLRESVTKDELLPAFSLVVTVCFILVGGYVMNYLVKMEEESVRKQLGAKGMKVDKKGKVVPELKIHELRAETYNGMIRLLKPGCRTIVLIVDRESKEKLVPKFYKLAWPYRRNKTLMFGFLYIEKGLPWFKKILNLTLPEPRDININPKNCIGTVLSLNGHRRYFCMYHAKHPEGSRRKVYTANNGAAAGAFMGFDSDELEDSGSDCERDVERQPVNPVANDLGPASRNPLLDSPDHLPIFEDQLLDGLQMWLDRLFEGSTYRYHINYWPEFPISPANFSSRTRD